MLQSTLIVDGCVNEFVPHFKHFQAVKVALSLAVTHEHGVIQTCSTGVQRVIWT